MKKVALKKGTKMSEKEKIEYLSKYIWYDKEYLIKNNPNKIIAYAMRYADIDDYAVILSLKERLKDVLNSAEAGWFDKKNWVFWHTFLKLDMKPFPTRNIK